LPDSHPSGPLAPGEQLAATARQLVAHLLVSGSMIHRDLHVVCRSMCDVVKCVHWDDVLSFELVVISGVGINALTTELGQHAFRTRNGEGQRFMSLMPVGVR